MNRRILIHGAAALACAGAVACNEATAPSLVTETQITSDVAQSSGDAAASTVSNLITNEVVFNLPLSSPSFDVTGTQGDSVSVTRTRTCYDANNAVVANCDPTTTRKIVVHFSINGSRTGVSFSGAVHRVDDDTIVRNFTGTTEVSRTHTGVGTANDTTSFSGTTATGVAISRTMVEAASDSIEGVTWNLPRSTNPFPVAGKIVRNVAVHVSITSGTTTQTRDVQRRIEIDFPADAQGNVVLKIGTQTCNLNLVTHAVTNCH